MSNVYSIDDKQHRPVPERPLVQTIREAREELFEFVNTRIAMLASEMRQKGEVLKSSIPFMIVGSLLIGTAWLVFTGAFVAILWAGFAIWSRFAPFLAFLCVFIVYAITGFALLWVGKGRLNRQSLLPERTIKVLKEDKIWLHNEARTQL